MTPADIVKGCRVTANPYPWSNGTPNGYDVPGVVLKRRGSILHFKPDEDADHNLDTYAAQWSRNDPWTYRIHVLDVRTVNGVKIPGAKPYPEPIKTKPTPA